MSNPVQVRLHVYDDLVARSGHRELTTSVGGNPECTSGADVVGALEDLLTDRHGALLGTLCVVRNGRPVTRAELCEVDVDDGDEFHAAWRPHDATTIVLAIISIAASAASAYLATRTPRPVGTAEPAQKRYGFNRFSNDAYVGDVIPVLYGRRRRYGGKVIAKIPVESSTGDGDAKLRMLICLGHGPIEAIGNQTADFDAAPGGSGSALDGFYLNDQPLSNFTGVRASGRLGGTPQGVIPGFTDVETLREVGVGGVELRNTSGSDRTGPTASAEAFLFTTVGDVNAVVARVLFPNGLYTIATSGQVDTRRVKYRHRWRTSAGPGAWSAWTVVELQKAEQSEFFSSPRLDHLADPAAAIDVQLERVTAESSNAADVDKMVWDSVIEVVYSSRTYDGFVMVALEISASEQIQGVPRASFDVRGRKVRVWDGVSSPSAPVFATQYTDNPAYHALDWLTNTTYGLGASYGDDRVDLAGLIEAAEYAEELVDRYPVGGGGTRPRFRFHFALDEPRDGVEWLRIIARAFRCVPVMAGGVWRFPVDRDRAAASEIFTDASWALDESGIARVTYTRELTMGGLTRANRFLCQFENEQQDGQPDALAYPEYGQFWLGGGSPETVREEALKLDGVTDPDQVMAELIYLMNRNRFLSRTIRGTSTKPVVMVQPGDRFDAAVSLMGWGLWSGRLTSGSTNTALRLDRTITIDPGVSYAVELRERDNARTAGTITAAPGTYPPGTAVAVSLGTALVPEEFLEYSIGRVDQVLKPFTCTAVRLLDGERLEWEVEGVEYDEDVYRLEPGPITLPPYSGLPSGSTPPGPVLDLRGFDRVVNGIRQVVLSWSQTPADAEITASFRIYRRRLGTTAWILVPNPHIGLRGAVIEIGDQSTAYEFCVVAVSYGGAFLSPYDPRVPIVSIVFGLGVPPPPPPANVTPTNVGGNTYDLHWDPEPDAVGYQVISMGFSPGGTSDGWVHSMIVARTIDPELLGLELAPSEDTTFWVRSVGINGRLSFTVNGCTVTAAIPGGSSIKQAVTLDSASAGSTLSNCAWVTVGAEDWLRMTAPASPASITFAAGDSGSLTASELTILPSTRNDAEDPPCNTLPAPLSFPSIAADQWGVVSTAPAVVGMLMPPYPDNQQAWLYEVRLHDGGSWGAWTPIALGESLSGTFQQWQLRATLTRDDYPYRPALESVRVVITH